MKLNKITTKDYNWWWIRSVVNERDLVWQSSTLINRNIDKNGKMICDGCGVPRISKFGLIVNFVI